MSRWWPLELAVTNGELKPDQLPGLFGLDAVWSLLLTVVLIGMAATTFRLLRHLQEGYVRDRTPFSTVDRVRINVISVTAALAVVMTFLLAMAAEQILPAFAQPRALATDQRPADCPAGLVALSFHGGPDADTTHAVLDILDAREVEASFFVLGREVGRAEDTVQRMVAEGHLVGLGGWLAGDVDLLTTEQLLLDMRTSRDVVAEVTDRRPRLVQPAIGSLGADRAERLEDAGFEPRGHTRALDLAADPTRVPQELVGVVVDDLVDGGVIRVLDGTTGGVNTVAALPHLIDAVHGEGYCFGRLDVRHDWLEDATP